DVPGECFSGLRINNRPGDGTEIAGNFSLRGNRHLVVNVIVLLQAFVADEEKRLVLFDRSAQSESEIVSLQIGTMRRRNEESSRRNDVRIANEVVSGTVQRIRSGLGRHDDLTTRGIAVFGREDTRQDVKFLNRIDRGTEIRNGFDVVIIVHSVQDEVVA